MKLSVDHNVARSTLKSAIEQVTNNNYQTCPEIAENIRLITLGTHLTYRYVLLTGILSKVANPKVNPLVLQVRSELPGAFDARSVCHKVIVPLEKELLGNRLGASNEPYLNKPARFPEMSKDNAVRGGNDQLLRDKLVDVLEFMQDKDENYSFKALCTVIEAIFERPSQDLTEITDNLPSTIFSHDIQSILIDCISQSWEGQSAALATGICYSLLRKEFLSTDIEVKVHPANQAGSSSKEVLDIDVYHQNQIEAAIEVKDKPFTPKDVEHAVSKAVNSGLQGAIFVIGPQAHLTEQTLEEVTIYWEQKNIALTFIKLEELISFTGYMTPTIQPETLVNIFQNKLEGMKAKDELKKHIRSVFGERGWI